MHNQKLVSFLRQTITVAEEAKQRGEHPFGCILVSSDDEVLLTQGNVDSLNHAELTLCRRAFDMYSPEKLWDCTLYTNFEPCSMCMGACYWSNIGRVVYGVSESRLLELTGSHPENMTMRLSCRDVVSSGQKNIEVLGPFQEIEEDAVRSHIGFWV